MTFEEFSSYVDKEHREMFSFCEFDKLLHSFDEPQKEFLTKFLFALGNYVNSINLK